MTEFFLAAATPEQSGGLSQMLLERFNIDTAMQLWLAAFGLLAQIVFFFRWVIQWIATEKRGEPHMPMAFWWCSFFGATMMLAYFFLRGDLPALLGQSVGWMVYMRNIHLERRKARRLRTESGQEEATERPSD